MRFRRGLSAGHALVHRCALAAHHRSARGALEPVLHSRARTRPAATSCDQLRPAATARGQQQCQDFCSAERRASLQMRFGWGTLRPARLTRLSGFPCWGTTAGLVLAELRTAKAAAVDREQVPFVASCSSLRRHGIQKQRSQRYDQCRAYQSTSCDLWIPVPIVRTEDAFTSLAPVPAFQLS